MLRNGASRLALRSLGAPASRPAPSFRIAPAQQWTTQLSSLASRRPLLAQPKPIQCVIRQKVSDAQKEAEARYGKEEIKPSPDTVTATSTLRSMTGEVGVDDKPKKGSGDLTGGLRHDVVRPPRHPQPCTRD